MPKLDESSGYKITLSLPVERSESDSKAGVDYERRIYEGVDLPTVQ